MGMIQVEPHSDSYTVEWLALQVNGPDDFPTVRRLVKNSPWIASLVIDENLVAFTQLQAGNLEQWKVSFGEWVVRSPHGKFWFMGEVEFRSQFYKRGDK